VYAGRDNVVSLAASNRILMLHLVKCASCGMLFLNNTDYELKWIHELYWKMMTSNVKEGHSVEINKIRKYLVRDLSTFKTNGTLLEIGCGEGEFLKVAGENGWTATGIEISELATKTAREKYGVQALTGTLEQHVDKFVPGSFDVVILWALIEHVRNPGEILRTVRRLVRNGGAILLYTPNANSMFHRLARLAHHVTFGMFKGPMECVIVAMHPMYFTPGTLKRLLKDNNFLVVSTDMVDIDLDFLFEYYKGSWWSNGALLALAKLLQRVTHAVPGCKSHMVLLAKAGDRSTWANEKIP
jgi:2-polyprenyl-3-methyl-5-hydroxy-6-metoxy-1,4-benzoquinol methylase